MLTFSLGQLPPCYPSGAKIRKNRPRCSPTGGFLCSFNTITPKSPHSKPFSIPFASVLGGIFYEGDMNTPPNGVVYTWKHGNGTAYNMPEPYMFGCSITGYPRSNTFVGFQLCYNYATQGAHRIYFRTHDDNVWSEWTALA